jgi:NADH-quinone oxidoreductase subunit I
LEVGDMSKGVHRGYFGNIVDSFRTLWGGLRLTLKHFNQADKNRKNYAISDDKYFDQNQGLTTLKYPHEMMPVPDNGRYKLHNEMEDCIVCDKCAKVCPVDCIEIEPIRSPDTFGETSDGTPKRIHAARFDIDMSKCCFCGLCTTVCPTECLTMTKSFDYSEFDIRNHTFEFGILDDEQIKEKKKDWETFEAEKTAKAGSEADTSTGAAKPVMKPKVGGAKPVMKPKIGGAKPVIKPKVPGTAKPVIKPKVSSAKPVIKPKVNPAKPVIKPKMVKPVIKPRKSTDTDSEQGGEK